MQVGTKSDCSSDILCLKNVATREPACPAVGIDSGIEGQV
jgi:hypothetical protein